MKFLKKALAILITMLMLVSVSAACTKKENASKTTIITENTTLKTEETTAGPKETDTNILKIAQAKVGDIIQFGNYEQDNNLSNGKEKIDWRVLAVENDKVLLLSEKILDTKPYNETDEDVTWETCSLRSWLNEEFYNNAFTASEKNVIITTNVINKDNKTWGTKGGNDTNDKVFLLSYEEAEKYFSNKKDGISKYTEYAKSNGLDFWGPEWVPDWWLRTPGYSQKSASWFEEEPNNVGEYGYYKNKGDRPALWINL